MRFQIPILYHNRFGACRRKFHDELALLQRLSHPNIVQFLGAVTQSNPMMIVTEYLPRVWTFSVTFLFLFYFASRKQDLI